MERTDSSINVKQMRITVISHKTCWVTLDADGRQQVYTDGGFPLQMQAVAELFDEMVIVVPCEKAECVAQLSLITLGNIRVVPLKPLTGKGLSRKIWFFVWLAANVPVILKEVRTADAVHAPIPGDIGTIGIFLALLTRKPLFVRHCGNWLAPRTTAEWFWKRGMELFAGGRNVMLATGGANSPPSDRNSNVKWIFSTSLKESQMTNSTGGILSKSGELRLITVSRQEPNKGTDLVIESLPEIAIDFPKVKLDVVGDGSMMPYLRKLAADLGVAERVRFAGKVKQPDVMELLRAAHIFCYPTSASEGFPKVILEALSAGLPVITTPVSVLPMLIDDGCGKIIADTSPASLASAVKMIARDSDRYKAMSMGAICRAQGYTLERWSETIKGHMVDAWGETQFRQSDQTTL